MIKLRVLALASISLCAATADGVWIRGGIVDASGAAVGGASVDLFDPDLKVVAHATADFAGRFQIKSVDGCSLILKAWLQGFRSCRVPVVVPAAKEIIDAGTIRLEVAGCDAPGVICDWFGEAPPPDPVVSRGYLHLNVNCVLALAAGKVICPGDGNGRNREATADLGITANDEEVFLTAINGAGLSPPDLPRGDCRDAYPSETKIRIDGLGPGDDICLHTHDRYWSHVFLTEDVSRGSEQIALWQITRRR